MGGLGGHFLCLENKGNSSQLWLPGGAVKPGWGASPIEHRVCREGSIAASVRAPTILSGRTPPNVLLPYVTLRARHSPDLCDWYGSHHRERRCQNPICLLVCAWSSCTSWGIHGFFNSLIFSSKKQAVGNITMEIPTHEPSVVCMEITVYPQMDLGRLVTASETVIISHLWPWDLREEQAAGAGHPGWRSRSALTPCCAQSWPAIHVRQKSYPEDLSGILLPKLCWFILHEECGCWEAFFGPSLSLPAETEGCCASILITVFASQWFSFPKLFSCDKGDSLHCFLLIMSWATPLQNP